MITMGKVFSSYVKRPYMNWNVEHRAQRVISQEKPQAAPRHKSTEKILQEFTQEHPELLNAQKEKDEQLLARLKGATVVTEKITITSPERPLPENRRHVEDHEFGYFEPATIPVGKCSLRQALEFISHHDSHSKDYTIDLIAKDYKLDKIVVTSVMKHFRMLLLQIPSTSKGHNLLKAAAEEERANKESIARLTSDSDKTEGRPS